MKNFIWLILIYFAYYIGWQSGIEGKDLLFDWHYLLDRDNYVPVTEWVNKYF